MKEEVMEVKGGGDIGIWDEKKTEEGRKERREVERGERKRMERGREVFIFVSLSNFMIILCLSFSTDHLIFYIHHGITTLLCFVLY